MRIVNKNQRTVIDMKNIKKEELVFVVEALFKLSESLAKQKLNLTIRSKKDLYKL